MGTDRISITDRVSTVQRWANMQNHGFLATYYTNESLRIYSRSVNIIPQNSKLLKERTPAVSYPFQKSPYLTRLDNVFEHGVRTEETCMTCNERFKKYGKIASPYYDESYMHCTRSYYMYCTI